MILHLLSVTVSILQRLPLLIFTTHFKNTCPQSKHIPNHCIVHFKYIPFYLLFISNKAGKKRGGCAQKSHHRRKKKTLEGTKNAASSPCSTLDSLTHPLPSLTCCSSVKPWDDQQSTSTAPPWFFSPLASFILSGSLPLTPLPTFPAVPDSSSYGVQSLDGLWVKGRRGGFRELCLSRSLGSFSEAFSKAHNWALSHCESGTLRGQETTHSPLRRHTIWTII